MSIYAVESMVKKGKAREKKNEKEMEKMESFTAQN